MLKLSQLNANNLDLVTSLCSRKSRIDCAVNDFHRQKLSKHKEVNEQTMTLAEEFRSCWLIATFGCILFTAGTSILFWNEGRAVQSILSLDEAQNDAVTVNPDDDIENMYDGRLVHMIGPILIGEPLTEPEYSIQVLAVKLKRRVQMYQWVEETVEHNFGETVASIQTEDRTYYYTMEWKDNLIDSRRFYIMAGHHNPDRFPVESQVQIADTVNIGKYELGSHVKEKVVNYIELTSDSRPEDPSVKLHSGLYYHCNDVFAPEIGDLRIQFSFAGLEGDIYTVIGKLEKGKVVPYETSRKSKILLVYRGEYNLNEAFKTEHHAQRLTTWGFRFIGWVLLFFGATCTASLLHIILTRIYFLSSLAPDPSYPVSANIILSLSLALVITSMAWGFHRPWIGATLMFAASSPFLYCARGVVHYQRIA